MRRWHVGLAGSDEQLDRTQCRLANDGAKDALDGNLHVFAPGHRGSQVESKAWPVDVRPDYLEAETGQVRGGEDAGRTFPPGVPKRLDRANATLHQVLRGRLNQCATDPVAVMFRCDSRGHEQDGVPD